MILIHIGFGENIIPCTRTRGIISPKYFTFLENATEVRWFSPNVLSLYQLKPSVNNRTG